MDRIGALALLGEYTAQQWGLVTTAQAVAAGVNTVTLTRLADAGHLQPVRRGVYALDAAPESRLREEQAVWLWLNPTVPAWERPKLDPDGGVLSHTSATIAHDVGDLVADAVELTVPRRRGTRDPAVKLHRDGDLAEDDVVLVDGLPVTSVSRTVIDLLSRRTDASHVAQVIRDGVEKNRLDLDELAARMGPYARRYGLKTRDGERLLDHLLATIATTRDQVTQRPARPAVVSSAVLDSGVQRAIAEAVQRPEFLKAFEDGPLTRQLRELNRNLVEALGQTSVAGHSWELSDDVDDDGSRRRSERRDSDENA
ncbi:type IV toxin-antitoxin system AbiEi family antitoxin domain-containing protein [Prauserella flavalba]|uniref:AbiEi antitoxin N-terminal domain-containing protein n=1 Tax=Prauserella flavalba TaxID=1477506 RepID=A0A318LD40_9PSEU|nr:type IV toxin-antitoxin system AbiEi family antitoxin domain-containing protein [Prauserella flavalba]PXY23990.1 hypothetical protein BA062_27375 [Prauserella flavalba]